MSKNESSQIRPDKADLAALKAFDIIESCKTEEQLRVAHNYCCLFMRLFGFVDQAIYSPLFAEAFEEKLNELNVKPNQNVNVSWQI